MNKIPKSFVMRSGIVGTSVTALVRDVRRVLEPNTASHLRVTTHAIAREGNHRFADMIL